ncbi:hypothetical protein DOY81_009980 [Sarcophaga bullata]|nr:hypothetical protein DOY81_009980 [Sarcophaga bullata]
MRMKDAFVIEMLVMKNIKDLWLEVQQIASLIRNSRTDYCIAFESNAKYFKLDSQEL